MNRLTLAHSPDADDMAMWWPLTGMRDRAGRPFPGADGRPAVDTLGFEFQPLVADIQELNVRAIERADLDITAISANAYAHVADRYQITRCGASIGVAYGPKLVVAATSSDRSLAHVLHASDAGHPVAIPGRHTTAFLTLRVLSGRDFPIMELPFHQIVGAVLDGQARAGLLIHEAQLDPESLGLRVITELGPCWTARTGKPLPLGLNVIRRDLDSRFGPGSCRRVAGLLARSVRHAIDHGDRTRAFLLARSDERPEWKDRDLLDRYLAMYVNEQTVDMGPAGVGALEILFSEGAKAGLCPSPGPIDAI